MRTSTFWLSNVDELRCLVSSLDAHVRKEIRGTKAPLGTPKSLSKLLSDISFLEGELFQRFIKNAKVF
jgi:hypothetical protein